MKEFFDWKTIAILSCIAIMMAGAIVMVDVPRTGVYIQIVGLLLGMFFAAD